MTIRDTDDARIANLRRALAIAVEKLEIISGDIADGFTPFALAQRVKIITDVCEAALKEDERLGGKM